MKSTQLLLCIPLLTLLTAGSAVVNTAVGQEQLSSTKIESSNPEAQNSYLRGWQAYRQGGPQDLANAVTYLEQAIKFDPDYAPAYSALAAAYWDIALNGWSRSLGLSASQARDQSTLSLGRAMELPTVLSHQVTAERAAILHRKPAKALERARRAIALDENDPAGHLAMAAALLKADRAAEAVESVRSAMRLDPDFPAAYLTRLGQAQFAMGQYQDATETLKAAARRNPDDDWIQVYLAAAYGQLGQDRAAKAALEKANALRAKAGWDALTTQFIADNSRSGGRRYFFKWFGDYKPLSEGLRQAGVASETSWSNLISSDASGFAVKGAKTIDAATAKNLHERGVPFVDIWFLWSRKHIRDAYYLDEWYYEFTQARLVEIAGKNEEVVIYSSRDGVGRYGPQAVARAVSWGYEKIYFFRDGLDAWKAAGYPVETGD